MVNSSLTYEILMYLNSFYFSMFCTCEIGMATLKFINLEYPNNVMYTESIILLGICVLESIRIHLGRKGSLSDHGYQVWLSVILTIPVSLGMVYLLFLQKFVLKLEYILCALQLVLEVTEFFFAILFLFSLCKTPTYE